MREACVHASAHACSVQLSKPSNRCLNRSAQPTIVVHIGLSIDGAGECNMSRSSSHNNIYMPFLGMIAAAFCICFANAPPTNTHFGTVECALLRRGRLDNGHVSDEIKK